MNGDCGAEKINMRAAGGGEIKVEASWTIKGGMSCLKASTRLLKLRFMFIHFMFVMLTRRVHTQTTQ